MKKMLISLFAIGAVLVPAGIAAAQTDEPVEPAPASPDDPTVAGRGWLAAMGTGDVEIDMGGHVRAWAEGDVTLTDHAGDMRFVVRGAEERAADDAAADGLEVVLEDFRGALRVRGSGFTVEIDGQTFLVAHGRGRAWLDGEGLYIASGGDIQPWDGEVELGSTAARPAADEAA